MAKGTASTDVQQDNIVVPKAMQEIIEDFKGREPHGPLPTDPRIPGPLLTHPETAQHHGAYILVKPYLSEISEKEFVGSQDYGNKMKALNMI